MVVIFLLLVLILFAASYGLLNGLARLGHGHKGEGHKGERP